MRGPSVFDRNAEEYDNWYREASGALILESEVKAIQALTLEGVGIEVGVGTGVFSSRLGVPFGIDPAMKMLQKALAINPRRVDTYIKLGLVYRQKGMLDDAITAIDRAITIDPVNGEAHLGLAVTYYTRKQYTLAIEHCNKAIQLGYQVPLWFLEKLNIHR